MRLCKDDSAPSPILVRHPKPERIGFDSDHLLFDNTLAPDHIPCLFQGSIGVAYNKKALEDTKITHIVTCAENISPKFPSDFKYLCLPLLDTPTQNIVQYFDEANNFITKALSEEPNARVLLHCFAGKSRASTITTQFLMTQMKLPLDQALRHVKKCRPIAQPNVGFVI